MTETLGMTRKTVQISLFFVWFPVLPFSVKLDNMT